MALAPITPISNRGIRSRWLASLPVSGLRLLTVDQNGDIAFDNIPNVSWGNISGTLSNQTDLQNALNAKLNLSGGTLSGALNGTSASFSGSISGTSLNLQQTTTPATPSSGTGLMYLKSDQSVYFLNSSGVENKVSTASDSIVTALIFG